MFKQMKAVMWNVDEVGSQERERRALVRKHEPDVLVLSELKAMGLSGLGKAWPGAKMKAVPAARKDIRSAPRSGIAMMIRPGLKGYVRPVRNEMERESNSVIQLIMVELGEGVRITGAYLSPKVSGGKTEELMTMMGTEGGGKHVIMRNLTRGTSCGTH